MAALALFASRVPFKKVGSAGLVFLTLTTAFMVTMIKHGVFRSIGAVMVVMVGAYLVPELGVLAVAVVLFFHVKKAMWKFCFGLTAFCAALKVNDEVTLDAVGGVGIIAIVLTVLSAMFLRKQYRRIKKSLAA